MGLYWKKQRLLLRHISAQGDMTSLANNLENDRQKINFIIMGGKYQC
jgi:hypothetical protein